MHYILPLLQVLSLSFPWNSGMTHVFEVGRRQNGQMHAFARFAAFPLQKRRTVTPLDAVVVNAPEYLHLT